MSKTTPELHIRPLHLGDAAVYRQLMLEAYALHPDAFTASVAEREALPLKWWEARVATEPDADQQVFGAFVDEALIGVAGLAFETRPKASHKAQLFGMYVRADFRQYGAGRALVEAVLHAARQRPGIQLIQLTVTDGNRAACQLYERCGFRAFGVEPLAVQVADGYVAKQHMWQALGDNALNHPAWTSPA